MYILSSRFFLYLFLKLFGVHSCTHLWKFLSHLVTQMAVFRRVGPISEFQVVWQSDSENDDAGFLKQWSLNLITHVSRTGCSFERLLSTTQSTSFTDSKLDPGVSSEILKYHRRWGPTSTSGSCRSGGEDLWNEPLPCLFCLPVTTFYSWSLFFSLISYLYMLENLLYFFLGRKDVGMYRY